MRRKQSETLGEVWQKLESTKPSSASLQYPKKTSVILSWGDPSLELVDGLPRKTDGVRMIHNRDRSWTKKQSVPAV